MGNRQIAGLHYGVCIKPVSGYCSVEWAQDSSSLYTFTVSGDTADLDTTVLGTLFLTHNNNKFYTKYEKLLYRGCFAKSLFYQRDEATEQEVSSRL